MGMKPRMSNVTPLLSSSSSRALRDSALVYREALYEAIDASRDGGYLKGTNDEWHLRMIFDDVEDLSWLERIYDAETLYTLHFVLGWFACYAQMLDCLPEVAVTDLGRP
jgi:hypothetical protein